MAVKFKELAPAKLNLFLKIVSKRDDYQMSQLNY